MPSGPQGDPSLTFESVTSPRPSFSRLLLFHVGPSRKAFPGAHTPLLHQDGFLVPPGTLQLSKC